MLVSWLRSTYFSAMAGSLGIVIATFNRAALVRRAVASVLNQDDQDLDLVIVDDGSDDDVVGALAGLPLVRVVRQPNLGVGAARNHGLRECQGDWVLVFDDDDVLVPGALAAVRARLGTLCDTRYPVVLFASSNSRQERTIVRLDAADYLEGRVGGDLIPVIQRAVFLENGLAYPESRVGGEHLLWLDVALRYGIPAWDTVIVQVLRDEGVERLTSAVKQVEHAREHAIVQEETLERFGELFRRSYPAEHVRRRLGAATYRLLAGDRAEAGRHLRASGLPRRDLRRLALTLLARAPAGLTRRAFILFRRVHNRM